MVKDSWQQTASSRKRKERFLYLGENQEESSGKVDMAPDHTQWEQKGRYACFHPMTQEDRTRLLKWLTGVFLALFLILILITYVL
jgi:hypothetical protein